MKKLLLMSMIFMALSLASCKKTEEGDAAPTTKTTKTKSAAKLSEKEINEALAEVIGESDEWQAEIFSNLKKDMSSAEVKKIYPSLESNPEKDYDFPEVKIKGNKIVSGIKFTFRNDKLSSATMLFKSKLDKDLFKKASLAAFETKWGKLDDDKREKDILTKVNSNYKSVQRMYMVDHWEISNAIVAE